MERYFGTYQTFQTASRKDAAALLGSDNLVGDQYAIECTIESGVQKAWLVNRFGSRIGYFGPDFSRQLSLLRAQDLTLVGILSFVAFSEQPEPGEYWGEAAVIAYDARDQKAFTCFVEGVGILIGKGIRPALAFDGAAIERIVETQGAWLPTDRVPLPEKKKGMAILKRQRSITDSLVEKGRQGNKGCYLLSWAFLLALVGSLIFGLKACGLF